jgi:signal transduction histidine kinase
MRMAKNEIPMRFPKDRRLKEAWKRSAAYGVDRNQFPEKGWISDEEFVRRLEEHAMLVEVAAPFLDHLYKTVPGKYVAVIADPDGVILSVRGAIPEEQIRKMCLSEKIFGANALGTALYLKEPVQMVGKDHYCTFLNSMTGAAAPLFLPSGTLAGAVAVAASGKEYNPYLLGLVLATGHAIEQAMALQLEHQNAMRHMERLSALGMFAAEIAHEIRNPITTIQIAVQLLQKQGHWTGEASRKLSLIRTELQRINQMVTQFLLFAKPVGLQRTECDIAALVRDICHLTRVRAESSGIMLEEKYDDTVPLVWVDPDQLRQVVVNLLHNAIDATPEKGIVTVWVGLSEGRKTLCIEVRDTGCGIAEEDLEKIFQPFYSTKTRGTGLGLSTSKMIVEAHGGVLDASSVPGKGTTMRIRIPLAACRRHPGDPGGIAPAP